MTLSLLPLCGSNAESSDPESVVRGGSAALSASEAPQIPPKSPRTHHENPHDFPPTVFVSLDSDDQDIETLEAAFAPEDLDGEIVAVYEPRSVGQMERRFVEGTQIEQRADGSDARQAWVDVGLREPGK